MVKQMTNGAVLTDCSTHHHPVFSAFVIRIIGVSFKSFVKSKDNFALVALEATKVYTECSAALQYGTPAY